MAKAMPSLVIPSDWEMEKALLGGILLSASWQAGVCRSLFQRPSHQIIFDLLQEQRKNKKGLDLTSVISVCDRQYIAEIAALPNACTSTDAMPFWVERLKEIRHQRDLFLWAARIKQAAQDGDWELLAQLQKEAPKADEPASVPQGRPGGGMPEMRADPEVRKTLRSLEKRKASARVLAAEILRTDPAWKDAVWFDSFRQIRMLRDQPWRDTDDQRISEWISRVYRVEISAVALRPVIEAIAEESPRDPLSDYLLGLRWDGQPRIHNWLQWGMGVADSPINRWVGEAWLIQAVARALQPGCQADSTLVFLGEQGEGKTSVFRILAGEFRAESKIDIGNAPRCYQQIARVWIYELGEMGHFLSSRTSQEEAKNFLTAPEDDYVPLYGHAPIKVKRRCVFIGTTNRPEILRDPTGSRRFWPVTAGETGPIQVEMIRELRDQIWAEAVVRFRAGQQWWLPKERAAELQELQMDYRASDSWEDRIQEWLADPEVKVNEEPVTSRRILVGAIGKKLDQITKADEMRCGDIMAALGWRHKAVWNGALKKKINAFVEKVKVSP